MIEIRSDEVNSSPVYGAIITIRYRAPFILLEAVFQQL
jgi:hypothetical protein